MSQYMKENIKKDIKDNTAIELSKSVIKKIDKELAKYPADQRQSAVMAALTHAQDEYSGYLTKPLIHAVADYLQIPSIFAEEAATFYSMYEHKPAGKHKICVCTNISCKLKGSDKIVSHLKDKLKVNFGEVTKDGEFLLKHVECLGACVGAPAMQIGDDYYENLTNDKVDEILKKLKQK